MCRLLRWVKNQYQPSIPLTTYQLRNAEINQSPPTPTIHLPPHLIRNNTNSNNYRLPSVVKALHATDNNTHQLHTIQKSPDRTSRWWYDASGRTQFSLNTASKSKSFIWIMPWFIGRTIFKEIYPIAEVPLFTWMAASIQICSSKYCSVLNVIQQHQRALLAALCNQFIRLEQAQGHVRLFVRSSVRPRNISCFSSYSNSTYPTQTK